MPKQKSKVRDISEVIRKNFDEKSKLKTVQRPLDHVKSIDPTKTLFVEVFLINILKEHGLSQNCGEAHPLHTWHLGTIQ